MPKLGRHRDKGDHVADAIEVEAVLAELAVLHHVEEQIKAARVSKLVHKVQELLAEAVVDTWARIDSLETCLRLNVIIKLSIEFAHDVTTISGLGLVLSDLWAEQG